MIATDISGSLVQSKPVIRLESCACLLTAFRIALILIASDIGLAASNSRIAPTSKPSSCHPSISFCKRCSRRPAGIPDECLFNLVSETSLSNSDNDSDEVGRSSASPFRTKSIHSDSSIDLCLAPLLARESTNTSISSRRLVSRSNSLNIAILRIISSSPSIEASNASKDSINTEAALYTPSSLFIQETALRGSSATLERHTSMANPLSSQEPIICIPSSSNSLHSWSNESTKSMNSSVKFRFPARLELPHLSGQRVSKSFHRSSARK